MATFTLAQRVEIELEIRKSRFIGIVMPVPGREAAMQEIARMRDAHRSATHVCWALMAGGQSGMSDDGDRKHCSTPGGSTAIEGSFRLLS